MDLTICDSATSLLNIRELVSKQFPDCTYIGQSVEVAISDPPLPWEINQTNCTHYLKVLVIKEIKTQFILHKHYKAQSYIPLFPRTKHYVAQIRLDEDCPFEIVPMNKLPPEHIFPSILDDDITPNYDLFKEFRLSPHVSNPALKYTDKPNINKEYTCSRNVYAFCIISNGVLNKTVYSI